MKVVALLTGRGNNTLPNKNIIDVLGKPVMYYPSNSGRKLTTIDSYYCSSDDEKILDYSEKYGYNPIVRPKELALPTSKHIDAIMHAISVMENDGVMSDILVVLLANNVTISSQWIDDCIKMMQDDMTLSAVVPIYQNNDHHPLRAKIIDENNRLQCYQKEIDCVVSTNRQDLPAVYFLSHNFWVLNTKLLLNSNQKGQQPWGFMGDNISYYKVDRCIDIHDEFDLLLAKEWIRKNYTD